VTAVLLKFLERFAEDESRRVAIEEFLELAEASEASSGGEGRARRARICMTVKAFVGAPHVHWPGRRSLAVDDAPRSGRTPE
jgi:hypothetical protein